MSMSSRRPRAFETAERELNGKFERKGINTEVKIDQLLDGNYFRKYAETVGVTKRSTLRQEKCAARTA